MLPDEELEERQLARQAAHGPADADRIFEMYADTNAYESHLQTPHFQKYKTGTQAW